MRHGANGATTQKLIRPQGPGGPAWAYRYRLALRRPYRYRQQQQPALGTDGWCSAPGARWAGSSLRYRLALRRPYRYRYRRCGCGWMVAEARRGLGQQRQARTLEDRFITLIQTLQDSAVTTAVALQCWG